MGGLNGLTAAAAIVMAQLGAQTLHAATYYVSIAAGDDARSCATAANLSTPMRTLNRAVKCLAPGDTLMIRGGTYAESLMDNIPSGTSWASPVTLKAFTGEAVTLRPNLPTGSGDCGKDKNLVCTWVIHFANNSVSTQQYIVIDGLILDAINATVNAVKITYNGSNSSKGAHHIRILNSEIKNSYGSAILMGAGFGSTIVAGGYNEFINNLVHHNGRHGTCNTGVPCPPEAMADQPPGYGRAHAFYVSSNNNLFERNTVYNNGEYGFHLYNGYGPGVNNNIVRNNRIYNNGLNATRYGRPKGNGIILSKGVGNIAYNNIIYGHRGGTGIQLDYSGSNSRVFNNTIFNNSGYGVYIGAGAPGAKVQNNIAYQNGAGDIVDVGPSTTKGNNLAAADPKFVNSAAFDFHLQSISPAINGGLNLYADGVRTDFAGSARPQTGPFEIGAYEYNGSAPPPPTFDFSLSNGGNKSVTRGGSVTNTLTASLVSGTAQAVSFSISGLPSGVTGGFSPASCTPYCSSTLTLSASASAATGSATVTVTGAGGGLSRTTNFTLTVNAPPPPSGAVTVDSTYPGYSIAPIDDGVVIATGGTTATWASASSTATPHWVEIVFPAPKELNTAAIHWAFNTSQGKFMTSQRVDVQAFIGGAFQTVASLLRPGADVAMSSATFPALTAARIKFLQPANMGNPTYSGVLWLTEVDYGKSAATGSGTDLNGDGITNVADVQIAVNQAVGAAACGSGDVNKDGACNVADVQLVINKALGL